MAKRRENGGRQENQKRAGRRIKLIFVMTVTLIAAAAIWKFFKGGAAEEEQTAVVTSSQLEKVLQISELSTYKVAYNGVAEVRDEKDTLLYYVAYESVVSIGIDMNQIHVEIDDTDETNKKIIVTLPKIEIIGVDVDPGSLDYIFEKKSAETEDVSVTAISACKADVEAECQANMVLFELARENAVNTIEALMKPLMEQYEEYSLTIVGGEKNE